MIEKNLTGLKVAIAQMKVVPGHPGVNADWMIKEIGRAAARGTHVIAFPEACVSGYMIGDKFEDISFMQDVQANNRRICEATAGKDIVAIFGSFHTSPMRRGTDGRPRVSNVAIVAQDGRNTSMSNSAVAVCGFQAIKTLQPNYRIFDDNRHFYSALSWLDEQRANQGNNDLDLGDLLEPVTLKIGGRDVCLGVILCEDMWHADYPFNPSEVLVGKGAEILFNLSASPWSWQKNRKRHSVVKDLLKSLQVPLVYVNNTGIQNNGKNVIVFDGSSTIYDKGGEVTGWIEPYKEGTSEFTFGTIANLADAQVKSDTEELFSAVMCAGKGFLQTVPPHMRKVILGLSGGIDSALMAQLFTLIVGPENVHAFNMPSETNDPGIQNIAETIARNLGINYEVIPITPIVDGIVAATGCQPGTPPYFNVKARARMEILATKAQMLGGVFTCNTNKVELAFGYGTMDGDLAGFLALIGDLVKREVYQLADYINKRYFPAGGVPEACFLIKPSAELESFQVDPFDYGNLQYRGYHDEMVRAFTEFRMNPEWFLEKYLEGTLDRELKLDEGHVDRYFGSAQAFIDDLERCWNMFHGAYFKRVQGMPIALVSKRAFGYDLREAIMKAPFTGRYHVLKKAILEEKPHEG